ncbi:glycosyltransferase family 92 protein [Candidatus Albibeggiatoa sp. nov. NOAA]|uniref:glycosyltransferase family 92 protein n=1 Tax=Candidatus Albibeggiatoa sp. nov. NOAA TaxID=3162724 RepID=UPI0032FE66F5|nr:glycosyltransferase family 92 protein [Thiotrichaceae bacterium]
MSTQSSLVSCTLSELGLPKRAMPRPEHLRQPDYAEKFDDDTLLYDIFRRGNYIYLIGPTLFDTARLKHLLAHIQIDPHTKLKYACYFSKQIFKIVIDASNINTNFIQIYNKQFPIRRSPYENNRFNKVLYTKQKDNDPAWIKDWILWYYNIYGVELVILYDNASTKYTINELKAYLADVPCQVIIESFPFKFGARLWEGSEQDSMFLQWAMLEHARYYVCGNRGYFFSFDIDELLIFKDLSTINWNQTPYHYIQFKGHWAFLDAGQYSGTDSIIRHTSHSIVEKQHFSAKEGKYIAFLDKLRLDDFLLVHRIKRPAESKQPLVIYKPSDAYFLHFRSITTNWKWDRTKPEIFDSQIHHRTDIEQIEKQLTAHKKPSPTHFQN